MLRLLIDTCVWLELAKDHRLQPLLTTLKNLVKDGEVSLIVPRLIIDEFARNKERVIRESGQSVSSLVKRAKKTVDQFGKDDTCQRRLNSDSPANVVQVGPSLGMKDTSA